MLQLIYLFFNDLFEGQGNAVIQFRTTRALQAR